MLAENTIDVGIRKKNENHMFTFKLMHCVCLTFDTSFAPNYNYFALAPLDVLGVLP